MKRNPSDFTGHSGGAIGSDTAWDMIGRQFGVTKFRHYYTEPYVTQKGNTPIPFEEAKLEATPKLIKANETLKRRFPSSNVFVNSLLYRNWYQVKNSEEIFAVGTLLTDSIVSGGTAWAVQMAIDDGKPVWLFDQKSERWKGFENGLFLNCDAPILSNDFAGIGTREISNKGLDAIYEVYGVTFR